MIAALGHNGMTRDEWLWTILQSGTVTRISQHLALVIYHLSDPTTNTARLSVRDLERITGWGRTAISEHLDELEIYVRVQWGQGRAKALFELQGVITEALKPIQNGKALARHADTTAATKKPIAGMARQPDTTAATTADITICGTSDGHKNEVQTPVVSAWRTQTAVGGDYRGGTTTESSTSTTKQHNIQSREVPAEPIKFKWHDDGSFSGTAFEHFTASEVAALRSSYYALDITAALPAADSELALEFERDRIPFGTTARMARLHSLLGQQNQTALAAAKPGPKDWLRDSKRLAEQLVEAAGACLVNPASAPGLLMMTDPLMWLEHGCDLELDILPTVRAISANRLPGTVKSWSYFRAAIQDNRDKRLRGMAPPPPPRFKTGNEGETTEQRNARIAAQEAAMEAEYAHVRRMSGVRD